MDPKQKIPYLPSKIRPKTHKIPYRYKVEYIFSEAGRNCVWHVQLQVEVEAGMIFLNTHIQSKSSN